jgi:L-rhamnose mutarotase
MSTRYVLTLDLVHDPDKVEDYKRHHRAVWPEVLRSLRKVGVLRMEIYDLDRRLMMIMDVKDSFDRARDFARHNASNPRCAEWETLMKTFQLPPPGAKPGEVWALMEKTFDMKEQLAGLERSKTVKGSPKRLPKTRKAQRTRRSQRGNKRS